MTEWQTIESAPKDGTKVLYAAGWDFGGKIEWELSVAWWQSDLETFTTNGGDSAESSGQDYWMPLPNPPRE